MASTGDVELRSVIKFCVGLGKTPAQTIELIRSSEKMNSCGVPFVYKWHKRFRGGRQSTADDPKEGQPCIVKMAVKDQVKYLIRSDRRLTVKTIAQDLAVSGATVHDVLTKELGMSKVSARWVPRLLTMEEKERRVQCSSVFLQRYAAEGDAFLDRIVRTDETWLHHYDPETKAQSSVWETSRTPPPKKARVQKSCGKEMLTFFMDRHGMILQHRMKEGRTVTADYYSKVLRRDLVNSLRRKCPNTPLDRIIQHHDNAPAHQANSTLLDINLLGFEILQHPPYSPDLAPMDLKLRVS